MVDYRELHLRLSGEHLLNPKTKYEMNIDWTAESPVIARLFTLYWMIWYFLSIGTSKLEHMY